MKLVFSDEENLERIANAAQEISVSLERISESLERSERMCACGHSTTIHIPKCSDARCQCENAMSYSRAALIHFVDFKKMFAVALLGAGDDSEDRPRILRPQ